MGWKGSKPLILTGDEQQLSPPAFSKKMQDPCGYPTNPFYPIKIKSLMGRLVSLNWPYIQCTEQHRIAPAQFAAANACIYGNIKTAEGVSIDDARFQISRDCERWARGLAQNGVTASADSKRVGSSPAGLVLPLGVNVENSYCYTHPTSTSKANSATAHFTLIYIASMKQAVPALRNTGITIVVPYAQQRKGYIKICLARGSEFDGISIATANTYQGWENQIVFLDLTAAHNLGGAVGFVADKHRLAVMLTRQSQLLTVVGDFKCIFKDDET